MDERQRPTSPDSLRTRLARFATVVLCASLCSAVVGAVGVKPNGAGATKRPGVHLVPTLVAPRLEPVVMVPVDVRGRIALPASPLAVAAAASVPAITATSDLLKPLPTLRPSPLPAIKIPLLPPAPKVNRRVLRMEVTAYCHCVRCCGPEAQGLTASGKPVSYNNGLFVAADTNVLPFGTKIIIPGYAGDQPVEVIDRGGAIKGYKIDVYYPNHDVAREWGRRFVNVIVVE